MHLAKYREHSSFFRLDRDVGRLVACRRPHALTALPPFPPLTSFASFVSLGLVAQQQWQGGSGGAPIFSYASVNRRRLHERAVSCLQCCVYLAMNCWLWKWQDVWEVFYRYEAYIKKLFILKEIITIEQMNHSIGGSHHLLGTFALPVDLPMGCIS